MKRSVVAGLAFAACSLFCFGAGTSYATTITYTFNIDDCGGGGCGASSADTVTLDDSVGPNAVKVTVAFGSGSNLVGFVSTGAGDGEFAFNLNGISSISVSSVTAGWTLQSTTAGSYDFDGLGALDYSFSCGSNCPPSSPLAPPLVFTVSAAGLTLDSFNELSTNPPGSSQVNFAADVAGGTGRNRKTGDIGATCTVTENCTEELLEPTPEPGSLLLLGTGLIGAAALLRRRFSL